MIFVFTVSTKLWLICLWNWRACLLLWLHLQKQANQVSVRFAEPSQLNIPFGCRWSFCFTTRKPLFRWNRQRKNAVQQYNTTFGSSLPSANSKNSSCKNVHHSYVKFNDVALQILSAMHIAYINLVLGLLKFFCPLLAPPPTPGFAHI